MGAEVGNAQVAVFPTFNGFRSRVTGEVKTAGSGAGKAFATSFKAASAVTAPDLTKLRNEVRSTAQLLSKSRLQQADQAGKVRVAEARLAEAVAKTGNDSARTIAAQENLAAAQRKLQTVTDSTASASTRLRAAQAELAAASAPAAQRALTPWQKFNQKLPALFRGGMRSAGTAMETEAAGVGRRSAAALSGGFGSLARLATGWFSAYLLISKATQFIRDANAEARESEKVNAITANALKTTGAQAWISAGKVGALATAISNKIGVDDEEVQASANLLLTFKNVRNEAGKGAQIFNRATAAAQDLAAAGFGSSSSAAKMLGKALNDPVKGLTALGRAGVQFSDSQKKRIKQLVKEGDVLGAQKIIMTEVESQVGGSAAAAATKTEKLAVKWKNFQELLGTKFVTPALDWVSGKLGALLDWVTKNFEPGMKTVGDFLTPITRNVKTFLAVVTGKTETPKWLADLRTIGSGVMSGLQPITTWLTGTFLPKLDGVRSAAQGWYTQLVGIVADFGARLTEKLGPIAPKIQAVIAKAEGVISTGLTMVQTAIRTATEIVGALWDMYGGKVVDGVAGGIDKALALISPFLDTAKAAFQAATDAMNGDWSGFWSNLSTAVTVGQQAVQGPVNAVVNLIMQSVSTSFQNGWSTVTGAASSAWSGIVSTVQTKAAELVTWVQGIPAQMRAAVVNFPATLIRAGRALITGLKSGATAAWSTVTAWISGIGPRAATAVGNAGSALVAKGRALISGAKQGAVDFWPNLVAWLAALPGNAVTAVGDTASKLYDAGVNLVQGMINGIKDKVQSVIDAAKNLVADTIKATQNALQEKSPSKVFHKIGKFISQGMAGGITADTDSAVSSIEKVVAKVTSTAKSASKKTRKAALQAAEDANKILTAQTKVTAAALWTTTPSDMAAVRQAMATFFSTQNKTLADYATARASVADVIAQKNDELKQLLSDRDQLRTQVASAIAGELDLAAAMQKTTTQFTTLNAQGQLETTTTTTGGGFAGIAAQVHSLMVRAKAFAGKVKELIQAGLPSGLIQQITSLGIDAGAEAADEFLSATATDRTSVINDYNGYLDAANSIGDSVAGQMYDAGIAATTGFIAGLTSADDQLEAAAKALAAKVEKAVKKELGIASPSKVARGWGQDTGSGFALGFDDSGTTVDQAARRLANRASAAAAGPTGTAAVGSGLGQTVIFQGGLVIAAETPEEQGTIDDFVALAKRRAGAGVGRGK